eukprot:TRINITY_DN10232_c0_g1_i1.p1 TRINITY_DN10232_c0_g1~~TRINITY_DN10232_c0_g1_i1.p1  ORF type:complete len:433 (+),score=119.33 TRINITY_DN10232_c0_g1_i1:147-1445(+)
MCIRDRPFDSVMNRARPSQGSPHTSPQAEQWQRKTVRELEVELETAAHFIRKMQETEEVLSNHVRDVVAEKNDAVQALTRLQGRVAGMENEIGRLRAHGQKADSDSSEATREVARMKADRVQFEEKLSIKAQAERHELMLQKAGLEGKLQAEAAKNGPLLEQMDSLKGELLRLKHERGDQDELIAQLHEVVKELKHSRENALGHLSKEQALSKHAVTRLEGALESAGIDQVKAEEKVKTQGVSAGMKMVAGVIRRKIYCTARRGLLIWSQTLQDAQQEADSAQREHIAQSASRALGFTRVKNSLARQCHGVLHSAYSTWSHNQIQEKSSYSSGVAGQLQVRLAELMDEHERTSEELRISDSERHRLHVQLKETIAERQILIMEVENLKTVGEQLVSDLVATASEVFDELESSRGRKAASRRAQGGLTPASRG